MEAARSEITLKLIIDTKANNVLFAEASKDFVDFLLFLLTLPIGKVIKLLANDSMTMGSIENLYSSFEDLDQVLLLPKIDKKTFLYHTTSTNVANASLLMGSSATPYYVIYNKYSCKKGCNNDEADEGAKCSKCGDLMTEKSTHFVPPSSKEIDENGYVQSLLVSYMIYDDLNVMPMSTVSSISMLNELNVSHLNVLQEKEVKFGKEEALNLLKMSFRSKRVLTDVFLEKTKS